MENADLNFIKTKLQATGRSWTPQRNIFYEYFVKITTPTDAESIWLQLRADGNVISRDTVYNTVRLLIDMGFADRNFNTALGAYEYWPVSRFNK